MREHWDTFMGRSGFWISLCVCLVVAGISGYFLLFDIHSPETAETLPVRQEESVTIPEQLIQEKIDPEPAAEVLQPEVFPVQIPAMPEVKIDDAPVIAEAPQLVVAPLKGDVLTAFSMDTLVYNPTLDDWRTHDGIDISAKPGTTVQATSAGTVESVSDDVLMGTTIVISHRDGYLTTYANLQSAPAVKAGDKVTAGQIIGAVGTTAAAEAQSNPHLHFSVSQNGVPVDPHVYLKK